MIDYETKQPSSTSPVVLIVAWLIVLIPAAWGVSQTVTKSMDLFRAPPPAPTTTTTVAK
jgi:hypothetical protein